MDAKIRPHYEELQAALAQAPELKHEMDEIRDNSLWESFNGLIDILNEITREDLNRFKVEPYRSKYGNNDTVVKLSSYRTKINTLINYLHGKYFHKEPIPFGSVPHSIITQSQTQSQTVNIAVFEVLDAIDKQLYGNTNITIEEKSFLENLKEKLKAVTNYSGLILSILNTAKEYGKNIDDIIKLLSNSL